MPRKRRQQQILLKLSVISFIGAKSFQILYAFQPSQLIKLEQRIIQLFNLRLKKSWNSGGIVL